MGVMPEVWGRTDHLILEADCDGKGFLGFSVLETGD